MIPDYRSFDPVPPKRWPSDTTWGIVLITLFFVHVVFIFTNLCPYWGICFPLTPIAPYFWPVVGIGLAIRILMRGLADAGSPRRRVRLVVAVLLFAFAVDTLSGGDYRWFELAMRWKMAEVGGPGALQIWAQKELATPQQIAALDDDAGGPLLAQRTPRAYQHWYGDFGPMYRLSRDGGPVFQFDDGGWDMGWGVIVGRTDLKTVFPRGINGSDNSWTKQIQPGGFLYAF